MSTPTETENNVARHFSAVANSISALANTSPDLQADLGKMLNEGMEYRKTIVSLQKEKATLEKALDKAIDMYGKDKKPTKAELLGEEKK